MPAVLPVMRSRASRTAPPPAYCTFDTNPPLPYGNDGSNSRTSDNAIEVEAQIPAQPPPTYANALRDLNDDESIYPARPVHHSHVPGIAQPLRQVGTRSTIADRVRAEGNDELNYQLAEAQSHPDWIAAATLVQNWKIINLIRGSSRVKIDDAESAPARGGSNRPRAQVSGWDMPGQPFSGYVIIGVIMLLIIVGCVAGARQKGDKMVDTVQ